MRGKRYERHLPQVASLACIETLQYCTDRAQRCVPAAHGYPNLRIHVCV